MAKTFIDMVQQINDVGWVVGDCFQLRSFGKWVWRVHLRDYSKSSEHRIASVYAEHAVLETAMASCVTQMRREPPSKSLMVVWTDEGEAVSRQSAHDLLLHVLTQWCEADPRFGKELTHRAAAAAEQEDV